MLQKNFYVFYLLLISLFVYYLLLGSISIYVMLLLFYLIIFYWFIYCNPPPPPRKNNDIIISCVNGLPTDPIFGYDPKFMALSVQIYSYFPFQTGFFFALLGSLLKKKREKKTTLEQSWFKIFSKHYIYGRTTLVFSACDRIYTQYF